MIQRVITILLLLSGTVQARQPVCQSLSYPSVERTDAGVVFNCEFKPDERNWLTGKVTKWRLPNAWIAEYYPKEGTMTFGRWRQVPGMEMYETETYTLWEVMQMGGLPIRTPFAENDVGDDSW